MAIRSSVARPDPSAGGIRRALQYAFYDWTQEMPRHKRVLTWIGVLIQGYALYAAITQSLIWPMKWPHGILLIDSIWLLYLAGGMLMNGMLTSEFVRKTQLESDLSGARRIQETLHPHAPVAVRGYDIESLYTPFRSVGGDYFDIVELSGDRTLFVMADVAGKGMSAALLAASVQALVRSISARDPDPVALAAQINRHLYRYSPDDRFVTAVFAVLSHESGVLTFVNAGHNAPILTNGAVTTTLEPGGVPLGLFADAAYEARTATLDPGGALLLFTDGLPDSIRGDDPETRIRDVVKASPALPALTALIDRQLNADDVTMVLVKRAPVDSLHM
jgi:serine phosphatase RsbU (regulator of sigma subunit)